MARTSEARAGGRPRSTRIDEALLAATWDLLGARGYAAVSLDAVARQAGTSRPAIYRRWSGRAELVLAAVADRLGAPEPPDTGCTLCDVGDGFTVFLTAYRTIRPEDLGALYADCATDTRLRTQYLTAVVEPARRAVGLTLDRASARGDLRSGADRDLLLDLVGSLVHYRAMFGDHLSDADADRALQLLLQGAAADYDALLAHAEAVDVEHRGGHGGDHPHSNPRPVEG